jgi:hypothetical protein
MATNILFVEGTDDLHVIKNLCKLSNVPETFIVKDCRGVKDVIEQFAVELKRTSGSVGVIIDADVDVMAQWQSVCRILRESGKYSNIPPAPPEAGLILPSDEEGDITAGVWIMPNNKDTGMLENFVSSLIPPDDKLKPEADRILTEIETKHIQQYKPVHKPKAFIHTWLAWQENPGTPMGIALTKKYLSTENEVGNAFLRWLIALFRLTD